MQLELEIERDRAAGRFSVAKLPSGRQYVHVDVDQAKFDGRSENAQKRIAKAVILKKFRNKVIGDGGARSFVPRSAAGEYAYPRKPISGQVHDAKMRVSPELDNLLATSKFKEHVKDDGHHPEAVGGWDYYSSVFEVGGKYFSGTVKLLVDAKGRRRFHDVTEIKEETLSQVDASTTQGRSALLDGMSHEVLQGTNSNRGSSAGDTIPKSGQNGNGVAKMSVGVVIRPILGPLCNLGLGCLTCPAPAASSGDGRRLNRETGKPPHQQVS